MQVSAYFLLKKYKRHKLNSLNLFLGVLVSSICTGITSSTLAEDFGSNDNTAGFEDSVTTNAESQINSSTFSRTPVKSSESLLKQYPGINYTFYNTLTSSLYNSARNNQLSSLFLRNIPRSDNRTYDYAKLPTKILADKISVDGKDKTWLFAGDIKLVQGDRKISANEVKVINKNNQQYFTAKDNIKFQNNLFVLQTDELEGNTKRNFLRSENVSFQLTDSLLHGKSVHLESKDNKVTFTGSDISSGPLNTAALNFSSSFAEYDLTKQTLYLRNTIVRLGSVPFAYLPAVSFRLNSTPASGFLEPSIEFTSNSAVNLVIPYYFRIRNNLDYLLTTNYLSGQGLLFQNQLRYLSKIGRTNLQLDIDPLAKKKNPNAKIRYYYKVNFSSDFRDNISLKINHKRVSDKAFFADYYSDDSDSYLTSSYVLSQENITSSSNLRVYHYEPINSTTSHTYEVKPEFNYHYRDKFAYDKLYYSADYQLSFLENLDAKVYKKVARSHIKGTANYAIANRYANIYFSSSFYYTYYKQHNSRTRRNEFLHKLAGEFSVNTSTKLRLNHLVFDKYLAQISLDTGYIYRRSSNQEDSRFQVYDSALIQPGIFSIRHGMYSVGVDRIYNANDISLGVKTAFIDFASFKNKLYTDVYFVHSLSKESNKTATAFRSFRRNDLLTNISYNFNDNYNIGINSILDLTARNSSMSTASLNYQPNLTSIYQVNYRKVTQQYIANSLLTRKGNIGVNQLGFSAIWNATPRLSLQTSIYTDINRRKLVDLNLAFNYVYYGWNLGANFERKRVSYNKLESKFGISLSLFGISRNSFRVNAGRNLDSGVIKFVSGH